MTLERFIKQAAKARGEFEESWSHLTKKHPIPQKKILAKYFADETEIEIADFLIKLAPNDVIEWSKKLNK